VDDAHEADPADPAAPLIDVTRMELTELIASDDTVLAAALDRVLTELDAAGEIIAGFSSYSA
jgi:FXSXX-COOH protein